MAFFCKGLARKKPLEFCPISRDEGELGISNLAVMFLMKNEKLLNSANCQFYSFYCFLVIKGKPRQEGGRKLILGTFRAN